MSEQELGKKLVEEEVVGHFIQAYAHATGIGLMITGWSERPDFLCERDNGSACGVEIVEIRRDPREAHAYRIAYRSDFMPAEDAASMIYDHVTTKDWKRQQPHWKLPDDTILVVQSSECPLGELEPLLDSWLCSDLEKTGFSEIWIADYTTMEAFREIQLFCVVPNDWRGRHLRAHPDRKPYG